MVTRKLEIRDYKKNEGDNYGRLIEEIFYKDKNEFVIYFLVDDYLNAHMRRSSSFTGYQPSKKYNEKRAELEKYILYLEKNAKINNDEYEYIRTNVAYSIKMCAIGSHAASIQYIQNVIDEIRKDVIIPQKLEFIKGSTILTGLLAFLALGIYYFNLLPEKIFLKQAIYCMSFSSLGNLFFYLVKMFETEDSENNFGRNKGYLNFSKSAISGLIIYTMIKSELLLGNFSDNIKSMVTFSLISGFSDDIPVKVIVRLSKTITGSDDEEPEEAEDEEIEEDDEGPEETEEEEIEEDDEEPEETEEEEIEEDEESNNLEREKI